MQKNVAGQKWIVFAFDITDNTPKTGDAANITANLRLDGGAANAVDDTNPTELEDGYYVFDITQAESNANMIVICPDSSTANIQVIGVPGALWTTPPNFPALGIESDGDLTQVNDVANGVSLANDAITSAKFDESTAFPLVSADSGVTQIARTGADGDTLETLSDQVDLTAVPGNEMALVADAITAAKYDESTAFPLKSVDSGSTEIARTGADGDTLETLSDEIGALGGGAGDYAVTVTIRTLGGTPIPGVCVWVNSTNDRTGNVAGLKYTDTNGSVVFNLEYTTYYVFCRLSAYTFAAAQFTASAGNVTFTFDIASATATGAESSYAESFLSRNIPEVRDALDEPTIKAKYDDDKIIGILEQAYIIVYNEINRNSKTPAVVKFPITIASNVTKYVMPHTLGSLYGVYNQDEHGGKVFYDSRGRYASAGRAMWMEGQTLNIQTTEMYGQGLTLIAEYIPNGVARLHNGVCTISADGLTVTFGATPNAGVLDTHHEAYAGAVFRHLQTDGTTVTGNYMQERNILRYDEITRQATLDVALSPVPTTDDGYIYYEVAPSIYKGMDTVVSLYAAYKICLKEGNRKRADGILTAYRNEIRNVRLTAYYTNMKDAPKLRSDSHENRRYSRSWRI
jgi:hypothetical protein